MTEQDISNMLRLNAMADGELDSSETQELLSKIEKDDSLHRDLCDIHLVKDMLKSAYPLKNKSQKRKLIRVNHTLAIAASIVLATLSFLLGTQYHNLPSPLSNNATVSASKYDNKVVLYIGESGEDKFAETLAYAEKLLSGYKDKNIQVDIVASSDGIDLVRNQPSGHLVKVSALANKYDSLSLIACSKTLAKLKKEGKNTDIIPEAIIASSAVEYVVKRLHQGWEYKAI